MRRSPRNLRIACDPKGLTPYGGIWFFQEFLRVLQVRDRLARYLRYPRCHPDYSLPPMVLACVYPIVLGLNHLETVTLLQANGTFHYLTGLPSYPDPQTLRRFLLHAPPGFHEQLHRWNDRLQRQGLHWPQPRSRLILDLDSTVVTVFGHQEQAEVGYNRRYRGRRSYDPLLCLEAHSTLLWEAQLRAGNAGTWKGSGELLTCALDHLPPEVREVRIRADTGFGYQPVLEVLEAYSAQYAVGLRFTKGLWPLIGTVSFRHANAVWEVAQGEVQLRGWSQARPVVLARQPREKARASSTLFAWGPYVYRAWVHNLSLTPAGVWHFYEGRAEVEPRILELREDFALRHVPTQAFAANALYLELIRLAYNLVALFQRTCLPEAWQSDTLSQLRRHLFVIPGHLTHPQNRPTLRLAQSSDFQQVTESILKRIHQLPPLEG